jgi:hypothetical protein
VTLQPCVVPAEPPVELAPPLPEAEHEPSRVQVPVPDRSPVVVSPELALPLPVVEQSPLAHDVLPETLLEPALWSSVHEPTPSQAAPVVPAWHGASMPAHWPPAATVLVLPAPLALHCVSPQPPEPVNEPPEPVAPPLPPSEQLSDCALPLPESVLPAYERLVEPLVSVAPAKATLNAIAMTASATSAAAK